jgi:O-antigen ligase
VIALVAAVLFRFVLWARRQPLHRVLGGFALTAIMGWFLVLGAFAVEESFGFRIVSRFQTVNDVGADPSSRQHFELLLDAQREFVEHPLIGSALVETRARDYPHNVAVESFMATGIIGGLMFCAFLIWSVRSATRLSNDPATLWISLLLVQQLVAALTAGAIYFAGTMWCMSGACVAIAAARRRMASVSAGGDGDSSLSLDELIPGYLRA